MEPTVVSGPLGHTQWESEKPFPLGFQTSNNEGLLCATVSGQTGLDVKDETFPKGEAENIFVDEPFELDNFISSFSCGDLHFEGGQPVVSHASVHSTHLQELSCTEQNEGLEGIADCTLSWMFSSNFSDVSEKTAVSKELTLTQNSSPEGSNVLSGQTDLLNIRGEDGTSSPISRSNTETKLGDSLLLVDFSEELSCLAQESTSELNLQGVTEEQAGPPPLPTVSPETGDKGLFSDQVTDLPITCSTSVQSLPESCLPCSHVSILQEHFEGSVPLLDLDVPDFGSSLCPAILVSEVCSGTQLEVANAEAVLIRNLPPEEISENDSLAPSLPDEPPLLILPLTQDACCHDDLTSERNSVENVSEDLIDEKICFETSNRENGEMALDLCLAVEEVHNDYASWDLKPHEDLKTGSALSPRAEQREVERSTDINQLEDSDHHEVTAFDFTVQDINISCPETGWTSEQTVETISSSKMVGDDSLPVVSAVNTREEDVSPLKAVFDALDQDGDGFVRIEEFMEFAAAYGADQVRCLVVSPS